MTIRLFGVSYLGQVTKKVQESNLYFMEMTRTLSSDVVCYLLPFVNSSVSGISIRTERQRVSGTYPYNEEEAEESDSTNLVWKLFEIRHSNLLIVNELRDTWGHLKKVGMKR